MPHLTDPLDSPPIPGKLGQKIYDNISKARWDEWMAQQTILINENRLNLLDPEAKAFLLKEMEIFLFEASSK